MRTPKDWGQPCPNPECVHSNRMRQSNVSAIATYLTHSGNRRIFRCHPCEMPFSATRETVFFDLRTSEEKVMRALKMLLVRVDLAGIGFVLGVTEETMLAWLKRATHQAEAINHHLLQHLPMTQVQLDEMWTFIARKHARETDEAGESLPESQDGRQGIWVSFAPEFRLMIAAVVGRRTLDTAKEVVAATKARMAGIPAFFSDGFTCVTVQVVQTYRFRSRLCMTDPVAMETPPSFPHEVWEWTPPEAQAYIRALEARIETLAFMVHTFQEQVRTLQEQLHQPC